MRAADYLKMGYIMGAREFEADTLVINDMSGSLQKHRAKQFCAMRENKRETSRHYREQMATQSNAKPAACLW